MKKTIEQQRSDLKAKLKKLEEVEQAEQARHQVKFSKVVLRAAIAARVNFSQLDEVALTKVFQKFFSELVKT
jgi:uncharacterized NAD(P)/FAD-binding protein YdhS